MINSTTNSGSNKFNFPEDYVLTEESHDLSVELSVWSNEMDWVWFEGEYPSLIHITPLTEEELDEMYDNFFDDDFVMDSFSQMFTVWDSYMEDSFSDYDYGYSATDTYEFFSDDYDNYCYDDECYEVDGAVGLSSGFDYNMFAYTSTDMSTDELTTLMCAD